METLGGWETLGVAELSEASDWCGFMFSAPPPPSPLFFSSSASQVNHELTVAQER
jgi:hypothetical protein